MLFPSDDYYESGSDEESFDISNEPPVNNIAPQSITPPPISTETSNIPRNTFMLVRDLETPHESYKPYSTNESDKYRMWRNIVTKDESILPKEGVYEQRYIPFMRHSTRNMITGRAIPKINLKTESEKGLFVAPIHFIEDTSLEIHTEEQTLNAFDSTLYIWRTMEENIKLMRGDMTNQFVREREILSRVLNTFGEIPLYKKRNTNIWIFAWRPSPSLNSVIRGKKMENWVLYNILNESGYISSTEKRELIANASGSQSSRLSNTLLDNIISGAVFDGGVSKKRLYDSVAIPNCNVVTYGSIRFELIMLAYRYSMLSVNSIIKDFEKISQSIKDNREYIKSIDLDVKTSRLNIIKLTRIFSIMKYVVIPLIDNWITLPHIPPCAELCKETADFMQSLVVAIKIVYTVKLEKLIKQKHKYLSEKVNYINPDIFSSRRDIQTGEGNMIFYGMKNIPLPGATGSDISESEDDMNADDGTEESQDYNLGKRQMGIATAFMRCHVIYKSFINVVYGTERCPSDIHPIGYKPYKSELVERVSSYIEKTILIAIIRATTVFLRDKISLPIREDQQRKKECMKKSREELSLAQVGKFCVNLLENRNDVHNCKAIFGPTGEFFTGVIHSKIPRVGKESIEPYTYREKTDSSHISIADPETLEYQLSNIVDFISETNCEYLLSCVPRDCKDLLYHYKSSPRNGDQSTHLKKSAITVPVAEYFYTKYNVTPTEKTMVEQLDELIENYPMKESIHEQDWCI